MPMTAGGFLAGLQGGLDAQYKQRQDEISAQQALLEFQREAGNDANAERARVHEDVADIQQRLASADPGQMEGIVREIDYLVKTVPHSQLPDEFLSGEYGRVIHDTDEGLAVQGPGPKEGELLNAKFGIGNEGAGASDIGSGQEKTIGEGDAPTGVTAGVDELQRAARKRVKAANQMIGSVVGLKRYPTEHARRQGFWRTTAYGEALDFIYNMAGSLDEGYKSPDIMQAAIDHIYTSGDALGISADESKKIVDRLMASQKQYSETGQVSDDDFRLNLAEMRKWTAQMVFGTESGITADMADTMEGEGGTIYRAVMYEMTDYMINRGAGLAKTIEHGGAWARKHFEHRMGAAQQQPAFTYTSDPTYPPYAQEMENFFGGQGIRYVPANRNHGTELLILEQADGNPKIYEGKEGLAEAYGLFKDWKGVAENVNKQIRSISGLVTSHPNRRNRNNGEKQPGVIMGREGGIVQKAGKFLGPEGPIEKGVTTAAGFLGEEGPIEGGIRKAARFLGEEGPIEQGLADLLFGRRRAK